MPQLRVLISSTVHDNGPLRFGLKEFVADLGFEPVLSEYSDVFYDHRKHTHRSCLLEVEQCDMLVLIISGRFGSDLPDEEIAQLSDRIDPVLLSDTSSDRRLSITQAEALTAISAEIPVYTFIDADVHSEYRLYRENRDTEHASHIRYPSIAKPGTAKYIFSFVELLKKQESNNAVTPFRDPSDIYLHLRKQWSALFRQLLREDRERQNDNALREHLTQRFTELEAKLLDAIGADRRAVARATIQYRGLFVFLRAITLDDGRMEDAILRGGQPWETMLRLAADVTAITDQPGQLGRSRTVLHRQSREPYMCGLNLDELGRLRDEWAEFSSLDRATREAVYRELAAAIDGAELLLIAAGDAQPPAEVNDKTDLTLFQRGALRERAISGGEPATPRDEDG
jgi:hypothetical protein